MKTLLLLLFAIPCYGQKQVEVVMPSGKTVAYVPQKSRTIIRHDTVWIPTITHDTTPQYVVIREQPIQLQSYVNMERDTVRTEQKRFAFGVFGYADFKSNLVAPAMRINLGSIEFVIYAGATQLAAQQGETNRRVVFNAGIAAFAGP